MVRRIVLNMLVWSACGALAAVDYEVSRGAALELAEAGRHADAHAAFLRLAEEAANDIQRADALEQAAMSASQLNRDDVALACAARIPIAARSKTVQMRLLATRKQWREIVTRFRDEPLATWPPSLAGEAFHLRGMAQAALTNRLAALGDLEQAAARSDQAEVAFEFARLAEAFGEDIKAMDAYGKAQRAMDPPAGWMFNETVLSRAAILRRNGKHEAALDALDKAGPNPVGYWGGQVRLARGAALAALGRRGEAAAQYRAGLGTEGVYEVQKVELEKALRALEAP